MTDGGDAGQSANGKWRSSMTDSELIAAVLAGETARFAVLVERYQRDIYNLAYRSTHHRQDAEDITQETFLRAYRSLGAYDAARPLRTWLYAIAVNVCRDWARRRASRPQVWSLLDADGSEEAGAGPASTVEEGDGATAEDAYGHPEAAALRRETQRLVEQAVMALEPEYRLLVVLHYFRGVSQGEAAEILGLPLSVVKNRLFRARRRLRDLLSPAMEEAAFHG